MIQYRFIIDTFKARSVKVPTTVFTHRGSNSSKWLDAFSQPRKDTPLLLCLC